MPPKKINPTELEQLLLDARYLLMMNKREEATANVKAFMDAVRAERPPRLPDDIAGADPYVVQTRLVELYLLNPEKNEEQIYEKIDKALDYIGVQGEGGVNYDRANEQRRQDRRQELLDKWPAKWTRVSAEDIGKKVQEIARQDPAAVKAAEVLLPLGELYIVGGAPRDVALGKTPKDIDLMARLIDGKTIERELSKVKGGMVLLTGKQFPVYRFKYRGAEVEIALPRIEEKSGEGNKDWKIVSDPSIPVEKDLERRDFTANAIAVNFATGAVHDPFGGIEDIQNGQIKTVTPSSFRDDSSRTLRALTQMAKHGLIPDDTTREQMREYAQYLNKVPGEMLQAELTKILKAGNPHAAIRLAFETGVLEHFIPEVAATFGFDQANPHHEHELGEHLLAVLERILEISDDPDVRLAALLHDIGKPGSQWMDEAGVGHYYKKKLDNGEFVGEDHAELGAQMAYDRLNALRFPTDRRDQVTFYIKNHMFPSFQNAKGARKFLQMAGSYENAMNLLALREADQSGKGSPGGTQDVDLMRMLVTEEHEKGSAFSLRDLAINGRDVIDVTGAQGPEIGRKLNALLEAVLENPELNNRESLLELVKTAKKTAAWADVAAKAKKLKDSGKVRLVRNGYNTIVAEVEGDTGKYQVEIDRLDPKSRAITGWTCQCDWAQYAFGRTRKWKKYEGRLCSHAMAAFWQSQASPLDDERPLPNAIAPNVAPVNPQSPAPGLTTLPMPLPESMPTTVEDAVPGTLNIPGAFSKRMAQLLDDFHSITIL